MDWARSDNEQAPHKNTKKPVRPTVRPTVHPSVRPAGRPAARSIYTHIYIHTYIKCASNVRIYIYMCIYKDNTYMVLPSPHTLRSWKLQNATFRFRLQIYAYGMKQIHMKWTGPDQIMSKHQTKARKRFGLSSMMNGPER